MTLLIITLRGAHMKLLYIWIEKFRNINNQGVVVDNEYIINVDDSYSSLADGYAGSKNQFMPATTTLRGGERVFTRKIMWSKNNNYQSCRPGIAIDSIAALIGKNAVGKSSILECLCSQEHEYLKNDGRYYFLVFFNRSENCIEIRSRGIHIVSENAILRHSHKSNGYEIYIIPLECYSPSYPCMPNEQTIF